jgi:hypothetical protein
MEDEVTQSVGDLLRKHRVHLNEVACSTALFLLASPDGETVTSKVAKWFHPDEGERYFCYQMDSMTEEYFAVVLFEGEREAQVLSFGVVNRKHRCMDIFSFKTQHPSVATTVSPAGYVVEIACIANDKVWSLTDFSEAKHIQAKYLQRSKNLSHYYPSRPPRSDPPTFLTVVPRQDTQEREWEFFGAQQRLQSKKHSWDLAFASPSEFAVAFQDLNRGSSSSAHLAGGRYLQKSHPLQETNQWGCLLHDIAAQSLTSASIPKTRVYVPWVLTKEAKQCLSLKIVV